MAIAEENVPSAKGSVAASPWITVAFEPFTRPQLCRKCVVVFETGHASSEAPQLLCRRAWPGAQLQHVLAQLRALQNPGQDLPARHPLPQPRSAEPCFVAIH